MIPSWVAWCIRNDETETWHYPDEKLHSVLEFREVWKLHSSLLSLIEPILFVYNTEENKPYDAVKVSRNQELP